MNLISKKNTIWISFLILSLPVVNFADILTPFSDNIHIAKINGEIIKEYDVFGYPASVKDRKKLTETERQKLISDYIFNRILQTEGSVPEVLNSEDYKENFDALLSKNAVDRFRQSLLNERFFNKKMIEKHYNSNKEKFSENGVRKDELVIADIKKSKEKEITKFIKDYLEKLIKENNVKYNEDMFLQISKIDAKDVDEFSEKLKTIGLTKELISFEKQRIEVNQLYNQIKQIKPYHIKSLSDTGVLKNLVDGKILNSLLVMKAKKEGMTGNKTVIEKTKDQMKYFVAKRYNEILTSDSKFVPTKDEMIDYYISHKNDEELKSKRKMWVFEIFKEYNNKDNKEDNDKVKVAIELENIRQKILNGDEFEKYAKFYPRPHSKDGELGFIFETDHAMIGKTASKMKEGEISDLIVQEKAISVIKVTKVQESMLYKFEYVEEIIKRNLIVIKRDKFLEDYRKDLFNKYKVEMIVNNSEEKK